MKKAIRFLTFLMTLVVAIPTNAHIGHPSAKKKKTNSIQFRGADCAAATKSIDQQINNVRARLLNGGDVWWDGNSNGRYIVPKVPAGQPEPRHGRRRRRRRPLRRHPRLEVPRIRGERKQVTGNRIPSSSILTDHLHPDTCHLLPPIFHLPSCKTLRFTRASSRRWTARMLIPTRSSQSSF